jgi:mono/diheme cytochrome c family protein
VRSDHTRVYIFRAVKPALRITAVLACGALLSACGSQGIEVSKSSSYYKGAVLFRDHCSGCHSLSVVGAQGSATSINNRVRTNGPNFNIRKENVQQVLYAIRNGGFSGAIMPENIVLGDDAQDVASFLAKYSGLKAPKTVAVPIELPAK